MSTSVASVAALDPKRFTDDLTKEKDVKLPLNLAHQIKHSLNF